MIYAIENPATDYIGLFFLVVVVGGALYFFWSKIKDKFK